jgi:nucleoside-diphosphate-sugar epimerase
VGSAYCANLAAAGIPYLGVVRERDRGETRPEIVAVGDFATGDWDAVFARAPVADVVHLAGRAHRLRDDAPDPAAEYRRQNVKVTDRLLAMARLARVHRFVFASTVKVHGEETPPGVVWRESDPFDPRDDYARSKATAEHRVRQFGQELGLSVAILRLPIVYGPGVGANFAALVDAVRARRVLPLGGIANRRSLVGIANLVSALDCVRTHPAAHGQAFFVSDGDDVSTPELVRAIAAALDVAPRLVSVPPALLSLLATLAGRRSAARRLRSSLAVDDAKIRRTLGWSPPSTMREELARLVAALPSSNR